MRRFWRRAGGLLLAAALALTAAGCNGGGNAPTDAAMGRYVETALALPTKFGQVLGFQSLADGTLNLLGYVPTEDNHYYTLHWYQSSDGGAAWTSQDSPALTALDAAEENIYVQAAAWDSKGTLYLLYEKEDAEGMTLARLEGGALSPYPWAVGPADGGSGPRDFQVADNGDIVVNRFADLVVLDGATGKEKARFSPGNSDYWPMDGYAVSGNRLAWSDAGKILFYDLESGKPAGELVTGTTPASSNSSSEYYRVLSAGSDGSFCFAEPAGIYRILPDSDVLEQLTDGTLNSLGTPALMRFGLAVCQDRFLLLGFQAEEYQLLSYAYDATVPTLPGTELKVYSLYDDPVIRQNLGLFQKAHPDTRVSYQVGVPDDDSSVTRDDALRALNTELVAGKGPDVLSLDGLPFASYLEKGLLADLSGDVQPLLDDGSILKNIAEAYRQPDGTLPAVPAQFQIPMMHGPADAVNEIHSLDDLIAWLRANRGAYNHPLSIINPQTVLELFYPVCAPAFVGADGTVDEAGLSHFLEQIGALCEMERSRKVDDSWGADTEFNFGALPWSIGAAGFHVGNLHFFQGFYASWTVSQSRNGAVDTLFGGSAYLPRTVLGVNAQSQQSDLARSFVTSALSYDTLKGAVGDGLPISAKAFTDSTSVDPDRMRFADGDGAVPYSYYGTTLTDGEGADVPINIQVMYPTEEVRAAMAERFRNLDTPLTVDDALLQIIKDSTADYLSGTAELTSTLPALMDKVKLYQGE